MTDSHFDIKGINIPKTKLGQTKMDKRLSSSEELFATKGFYNTSISDICRHAGTAVGTFYIYFETKIDVYRYLLEKYKTEIKHRLADSITGCENRYEREREGIKCFIKYAVSNPNAYNIIWGSLSIDKQMFTDYYVSFAKSYSHGLAKDGDEARIREALLHDGAWKRMLDEDATTTFEGWGKETKWNTSLFHLTMSYAALFIADVDLKPLFS